MSNDSQERGRSGTPNAPHWLAVVVCAFVGVGGVGFAVATAAFLGWVFAGFLLLGARFWLRPGPADGRLLAKTLAGVFAAIVLLLAGMIGLWETAEVVVLHHLDENGESFGTRLWVIDLDGYPSFAASASARRVALLERHPDVALERGGQTECRRAVIFRMNDALDDETRRLFEEQAAEARRLYEEKYGFRVPLASKLVVFLLGGPGEESRVLVRLEPCTLAWRPGRAPEGYPPADQSPDSGARAADLPGG